MSCRHPNQFAVSRGSIAFSATPMPCNPPSRCHRKGTAIRYPARRSVAFSRPTYALLYMPPSMVYTVVIAATSSTAFAYETPLTSENRSPPAWYCADSITVYATRMNSAATARAARLSYRAAKKSGSVKPACRRIFGATKSAHTIQPIQVSGQLHA